MVKVNATTHTHTHISAIERETNFHHNFSLIFFLEWNRLASSQSSAGDGGRLGKLLAGNAEANEGGRARPRKVAEEA